MLLDQADADVYNSEGNPIKVQNPPKVVFEDQHGELLRVYVARAWMWLIGAQGIPFRITRRRSRTEWNQRNKR